MYFSLPLHLQAGLLMQSNSNIDNKNNMSSYAEEMVDSKNSRVRPKYKNGKKLTSVG